MTSDHAALIAEVKDKDFEINYHTLVRLVNALESLQADRDQLRQEMTENEKNLVALVQTA